MNTTTRDAALAAAEGKETTFFGHAMNVISTMRGTYRADEIRARIESLGYFPNHYNAWGPMFGRAVKEGHLHKTGDFAESKYEGHNGRLVPVYVA